ncbi:MAG: hypothetical protein AB1523_05285 [Bacillota bacterium]
MIPKPTTEFLVGAVLGLGVLLSVCAVIGLIARRRAVSYEEYLVGRRDIHPFVTGCAIASTYLSGWSLLGTMGVTYAVGWSGMWFSGMWTHFGIIPTLLIAARKLSDFSTRNNTKTLAEIVQLRYDSKVVSSMAAVAMALLLFGYSVGQLKAAGTMWYAITGLSPFWCLLIALAVVLIYIMVGGYTGTQWALAFQGIVFFVTCSTFFIVALSYVGGPSGMEAKLAAQDPNLLRVIRPDLPKVGTSQLFSSWVGITSTFVLFFAMSTGFPHNVSRFLGMQPIKKKADFIWLVIPVFFIAGSVILDNVVGIVARAVFGPELLKIAPWKGDLAAPFLAMVSGGVPLTTLYTAGVFAATLGTFSAMIMIISSNISHDIIGAWWPKIQKSTLLFLNRLLLIPAALVPFFWTLYSPPPLLGLLLGQAAAGLGGIFLPVITLGLWWRRATKVGAAACIIYGISATIICSMMIGKNLIGMGTAIWLIIVGSFICYIVGSLLSKPLPEEKLDKLLGNATKSSAGSSATLTM